MMPVNVVSDGRGEVRLSAEQRQRRVDGVPTRGVDQQQHLRVCVRSPGIRYGAVQEECFAVAEGFQLRTEQPISTGDDCSGQVTVPH